MASDTVIKYIDGLAQDYSNPSALTMELLRSCTKPSIGAKLCGDHRVQLIT